MLRPCRQRRPLVPPRWRGKRGSKQWESQLLWLSRRHEGRNARGKSAARSVMDARSSATAEGRIAIQTCDERR